MTFVALIIGISILHKAYFIFFGLWFWLMDLLLRFTLVLLCHKKIQNATITNLPGDVIRMVFQMNPDEKFEYKSGQYLCICIPEISCFEWHPLSISSSPHEKEFAIHFAVVGNWTKKIQNLIETKGKALPKKITKSPIGIFSGLRSIVKNKCLKTPNKYFPSPFTKESINSNIFFEGNLNLSLIHI